MKLMNSYRKLTISILIIVALSMGFLSIESSQTIHPFSIICLKV
jgi:hypothetical protein